MPTTERRGKKTVPENREKNWNYPLTINVGWGDGGGGGKVTNSTISEGSEKNAGFVLRQRSHLTRVLLLRTVER